MQSLTSDADGADTLIDAYTPSYLHLPLSCIFLTFCGLEVMVAWGGGREKQVGSSYVQDQGYGLVNSRLMFGWFGSQWSCVTLVANFTRTKCKVRFKQSTDD